MLPHVQSGHHVYVDEGETWGTLAAKFRMDVDLLKAANSDVHLRKGAWVFVPLRRGILSRSIASESFYEGQFLWPVPAVETVSSHFGPRNGRAHEGIDIPARIGTHFVAAADGVVIYSGRGLTGFGNLTVIDHQNGTHTVYGHAHKNFTKNGERVSRGQVIGQVGNTGRSSGPHLHFEIRVSEKAVNPMKYLEKSHIALKN